MTRLVNRRRLPLAAIVIGAAACAWLAACTNDPFDPDQLPNQAPTVRFFVEPVDADQNLNPTSYFSRTFHWSGSDADGQVAEYHVSIRPDAGVEAPWDTTSRTDTTMTFTTDDEGLAEATVYLACRDDRGAMSDTLVRFVPLRNFPPILNFQSDFDPLVNLQREFVYDGEAIADTVYWNWGVMNLRCFAFDLDGNSTMDATYRYTAADTDPDEVRAWDDPEADPMLHWLEAPLPESGDVLEFEIVLKGLPAGQRTVTVAVTDEADAETRLTYSWEVRAPQGRVLVVPDNSGGTAKAFYREFLASYFGEDGWDEYEFWFGYPDDDRVLLESMRLFDAVMWFDGGGTSAFLKLAAEREGAVEQYVLPTDGVPAGRLLMISRNLTGASSGLPYYFRQAVIGVSPAGLPASAMEPTSAALGAQALGAQAWLPAMTLESRTARGIGLEPLTGSEVLYQFEECRSCFGRRPPYDPIIGVRRPDRATSELARTVGISFQLEYMNQTEAQAALAAIFEYELGVTAP